MNRPYCNACGAYLLDETLKPKRQIVIKDIMIFEPHKGAGQINEAHFCDSDCLKKWTDDQFAQTNAILTDRDETKKIVQLHGA